MTNQGRVRTVTVGGRPNNQPMAVIGGVQGAQVEKLADLQAIAAEAIEVQIEANGNSSTKTSQTRKLLGSLASPPPIAPAPSDVSVNLLDSIAQGDTSATPLQFSGSITADCRFYYMPADIISMANTWARVAQGDKAGGSGRYINGSLGNYITTLSNGSGGIRPRLVGGMEVDRSRSREVRALRGL